MHLVKTILCRFEMVLIIYANYFILTLLLYKTMCNRNWKKCVCKTQAGRKVWVDWVDWKRV